MKEKICAIISGGAFSPLTDIEKTDFVIACDKGCAYALEHGVSPDLLVGDFDSYSGAHPAGVRELDLPKEKDDTDTMAAVRWAVGDGYTQLWLYCALGGRLDHLLGNVQAAGYATARGVRVRIYDAENELYFLTHGTLTLPPRPGFSLSVLSMSDICEDVCIRGTKYLLDHVQLCNTFPIGISNEWAGNAEISVGSGVLMVILSKM